MQPHGPAFWEGWPCEGAFGVASGHEERRERAWVAARAAGALQWQRARRQARASAGAPLRAPPPALPTRPPAVRSSPAERRPR
eukprot:6614172-Prymnesium_polylepis.1